jgi:hypothetical protein
MLAITLFAAIAEPKDRKRKHPSLPIFIGILAQLMGGGMSFDFHRRKQSASVLLEDFAPGGARFLTHFCSGCWNSTQP